MCGIAGYVSSSSSESPRAELIEDMNSALVSRGPDAGGTIIDGRVALAHRRLSIIDLATGGQPMTSRDENYTIVFNGEIYNYVELRGELEELGHVFDTKSDTEVLLTAWQQWGEDCVKRMRGMFAFAVFDRAKNRLSLIRDRLGIKPIIYTRLSNGSFAFASELKSLLTIPGQDIEYCVDTVHQYLHLGYVPDDMCFLKGFTKQAAGTIVTVELSSGKLNTTSYWTFPLRHPDNFTNAKRKTFVAEAQERVKEAVNVRMVADVPLGAFLSGGLDSSLVVANMASEARDPIIANSIRFMHSGFDESDFAKSVAARYGVDHHIDDVEPFSGDSTRALAQTFDEPFADISAVPTERVCRNTRRHVVVALSGDGADEIFGGYRRYRFHMNEQRIRNRIPQPVRKYFFGSLGNYYPKLDRAPQWLRAKSTLRSLAMSAAEAYFSSVSIAERGEVDALWSDDLKYRRLNYRASDYFVEHASRVDTEDRFGLIQYLDAKTWLPGDILTKVDRASMANSLEVRVPFLDHHLVEWASTIPTDYLIDARGGKSVLKSAAESQLPMDVIYRKKMGFVFPIDDWLRSEMSQSLADRESISELVSSGLFSETSILSLFADHLSKRRNHGRLIWALLVLNSCMKRIQDLGAARRTA